ncbi:hypothetical protein KDA_41250 [Dictyobacter alpinus]|uniref:Glycosyltransferase RgtA/B/C/D-like domain-containing protein n=1 Tax=Dictyobacter alpinus TaxID=2014873 RepID=A0A402BB34_9CHLR|nr:glycosyltransferase family 39 protein [Dictyobacter alpinus]GCE28641.1 hypothetical protein KDA_41250 [Dictyobacter alpinus]
MNKDTMYPFHQTQVHEKSLEEGTLPLAGIKKEPAWWRSWELYLIILLAVVLRLYRIDTAQYMTDHNTFYQMAHDAVANGLWPISGNRSSTGPLIPPLFIYIMMIPAAITANPVGGNILVALCNIAAVLLTYIFMRRYYGRLAGTISALLYATAINVIIFSRDIWQPDLLPLLVILLLFMLFRGVVQKKHYWFSPAVLLIAAMYQLHSTAVYLVVPLLVALVLAFKTIRWRELPLIILGLLVSFAPYIYLEHRRQYIDIIGLFNVASRPSTFNTNALLFYNMWVHSFVLNPLYYLFVPPRINVDTHLIPSNAHSILLTTPLQLIAQFSHSESRLMSVLLVGAWLTVALLIIWPFHSSNTQPGLRGWWKNLLNSPERQGLLLLLVWQGTSLLLLRHSVSIFIHYLIYLLPGPFILIGILLATIVQWVRRVHFSGVWLIRYGIYALVGLLVIVQTVGSAGWLIDHARGNFDNHYAFPQYFDLATTQRIVDNANQLAQQQHLSRIYIDIQGDDVSTVTYLAQFAHTPIAVSDATQCLMLPDVASGPVVYVTDPNQPDIDSLLQHYTTTTSVGEIPHPGGAPLKMYVLRAKPEPQPALKLSGGLQLLSQQADVISMGGGNPNMLVTRWKMQDATPPAPRAVYNYRFLGPANLGFITRDRTNTFGANRAPYCRMSRNWSGDELIPLFAFNGHAPQQLTMGVEKFSTAPKHYDRGTLKMVIYDIVDGPHSSLHTTDGKGTIKLSVHAATIPH